MRRWVTADVTEAAHSEAKKLLFHVDKDNVSVWDMTAGDNLYVMSTL